MNYATLGLRWFWYGPSQKSTALYLFSSALLVIICGTLMGAARFPGNFDWQYRVISSLASQLDNPKGYWPFCVSIAASFVLVFPLAGYLHHRMRNFHPKLSLVSAQSFRLGAIGGMVVGLERGLVHNLSSMVFKSHEAIAFLAFAGIFTGILGFFCTWWRAKLVSRLAASGVVSLVVGPFAATAFSQVLIYFRYRHLGWVSPYWRELGIPVYLSFAFWQWLASAGAFLSMGLMCYLAPSGATSLAPSKQTKPLDSE
jgi:hypothetical protein